MIVYTPPTSIDHQISYNILVKHFIGISSALLTDTLPDVFRLMICAIFLFIDNYVLLRCTLIKFLSIFNVVSLATTLCNYVFYTTGFVFVLLRILFMSLSLEMH